MKITMNDIVNIQPVLLRMKDAELSIATAYKLTKLYNRIIEEYEFYTNHLTEIVQKYAEKDENGEYVTVENNMGIKIQEDYVLNATSEIDTLLGLEVEMPDIKFKTDELNNVKLTMSEMAYLMDFIEE